MTAIDGLIGLRPDSARVADITAPPYDVIKPGSQLERLLADRPDNLYQVTLGDDPRAALARLQASGALQPDDEPAYYVYEQSWSDGLRLGVFAAVAVSDYAEAQVIRHEKTFDDKVAGRIALATITELTIEPIFLLTKARIQPLLEDVRKEPPLYDFDSDFAGLNDLDGLHTRVWRVPAAAPAGQQLQALVAEQSLYIADGHHRYHAALRHNQTHVPAYICEEARIQAYNRVITGTVPFADIQDHLPLRPCEAFHTPAKHQFCIYTGAQSYLLDAQIVPSDVVGRLDCSILERELYPQLGVDHSKIVDPKHFDYYPESQLDQMQARVDEGTYDIAVALHPVSIDDLMAVADAGLDNPDVVMPEKSTFFAPKILSGLMLYRHSFK